MFSLKDVYKALKKIMRVTRMLKQIHCNWFDLMHVDVHIVNYATERELRGKDEDEID